MHTHRTTIDSSMEELEPLAPPLWAKGRQGRREPITLSPRRSLQRGAADDPRNVPSASTRSMPLRCQTPATSSPTDFLLTQCRFHGGGNLGAKQLDRALHRFGLQHRRTHLEGDARHAAKGGVRIQDLVTDGLRTAD